ncbi:fungal-specific transcription factor domain-containing protein [Syncephalis fuscata]|nr:fungal-specific transcription factor domain-containing protein [Syncephalis fuscata]
MSGNDYPSFYAPERMQRTLPNPGNMATRPMGMETQRTYQELANLANSPVTSGPSPHYSALSGNIGGSSGNNLGMNTNVYGNIAPQPPTRAVAYSGEPSSLASMRFTSTGNANHSMASITASSAAQHLEASSSAVSKRQRVSRACDACRRKKVRCDGVRPICGNCSAFHFECTYLDAAKKRGPPKGYIEAIEHRLRRMEKLLGGIVKHDPRLESVMQDININDLSEADIDINDQDGVHEGAGMNEDDKRNGGGRRGRQTMAWGHRLEAMDRLLTQATQGLGLDEQVLAALGSDGDHTNDGLGEDLNSRNRSRSRSDSLSDLEVMIADDYDEQCTTEGEQAKSSQNSSAVTYDEHGNLRYMGGSSGAYLIVDRRIMPNAAMEKENAASRLLQHLAMPSAPFRRLRADVELPPPEMSNRLISIYFARLHPFHPFVHKAAFLRCLRDRRRPPLLLLNAIYAIAARWANDPSLYAEPGKPLTAGQVFFDRARVLLDDEYDRSELTTVQALIVMSFYQHGCSQSMSSWLLAGMAFRMAHDLGMHRDCERWGLEGLDRVEKETRRRVWWACFVVDSMTSAALGRPLAIDERDIDAQLPRIDEDEEMDLDVEEASTNLVPNNSSPNRRSVSSDISSNGGGSNVSSAYRQRRGANHSMAVAAALPGGHAGPNPPASLTSPSHNAQLSVNSNAKPSPVLYYIQLIKLAELMAKVLRNVYGPRAARNNLYEVASRMDVELDTWIARLPTPYHYREDDFTYTSTTISPFTGLLHIFFDVTRILLHRPLIVLPTATKNDTEQAQHENQEEKAKVVENPPTPAEQQQQQQQQQEQEQEQEQGQQQQQKANVGGWSSFRICCDAAQRITRIADCMRVGGYLRCHGIIFIGYSLFQASMVHLNNAVAPDEAICRPARGHLALGLRALEEVQKDWLSAKQCRAILLDLMEVRGIRLTEADYGNTSMAASRRTNKRIASGTKARSGSNTKLPDCVTVPNDQQLSPPGTSPITSAGVLKIESQSPTSIHGFLDSPVDSMANHLSGYTQGSESAEATAAGIAATTNGQCSNSSLSSLNASLFPPSYGLSDAANALFNIPGVQGVNNNPEAAAAAAAAAALMMSNPQAQTPFELSMSMPTSAMSTSSPDKLTPHLSQHSVSLPAMSAGPSPLMNSVSNQSNNNSAASNGNINMVNNNQSGAFWGMPSSLDLNAWQTYLNQWGLPNMSVSGAESSAGVVAEIPQVRPMPNRPIVATSNSSGLQSMFAGPISFGNTTNSNNNNITAPSSNISAPMPSLPISLLPQQGRPS